MKYDKLVRDKIPQIIVSKGKNCKFRLAAKDEEYEKYLLLKLQEEVDEFKEDPCSEELADIKEVLDAIEEHYCLNSINFQEEKYNEKGGFRKRFILEEVED